MKISRSWRGSKLTDFYLGSLFNIHLVEIKQNKVKCYTIFNFTETVSFLFFYFACMHTSVVVRNKEHLLILYVSLGLYREYNVLNFIFAWLQSFLNALWRTFLQIFTEQFSFYSLVCDLILHFRPKREFKSRNLLLLGKLWACWGRGEKIARDSPSTKTAPFETRASARGNCFFFFFVVLTQGS